MPTNTTEKTNTKQKPLIDPSAGHYSPIIRRQFIEFSPILEKHLFNLIKDKTADEVKAFFKAEVDATFRILKDGGISEERVVEIIRREEKRLTFLSFVFINDMRVFFLELLSDFVACECILDFIGNNAE